MKSDLPSKYIAKEKTDWFSPVDGVEATKDDEYFPEISYSAGNENEAGYNDIDSSEMDVADDRKLKAMEILQASLDANQHVSKRKFTAGRESLMYNSLYQTLPAARYSVGLPSSTGSQARAVETLPSPIRNGETMSGPKPSSISRLGLFAGKERNGEIGDHDESKASVSDAPMSSSVLLDKFLKPAEARTQNRFTSVDSLLTKILNE